MINEDVLVQRLEMSYLIKYPTSLEDKYVNNFLKACRQKEPSAIAMARRILLKRANEIILGESDEVFWFSSEFSDVLTQLVEQDPKTILAFELISINRSDYVEKEKLSIIMRHLIKGAVLALPYVRSYISKQKSHRFCLDTRYCVLLRLRLI